MALQFTLEQMAARHSVRSFDGRPLSETERASLFVAMPEALPGPFGGRARFRIVEAEAASAGESGEGAGGAAAGRLAGSGRVGTYGLISRVPAFLVGAVRRGPRALEDFGYAMEGLVLEATRLGLGSCWIGGLFDRGAAAAALALDSGELLPAVVALGHPAERRQLAERITRGLARPTRRRPPEELFFEEELGRPLPLSSSRWKEAFEALRWAPSASNKQPWRVLAVGPEGRRRFHFLLAEDRVYNSLLGEIHLQNLDLGIGMRHWESAVLALGLPGAWAFDEAPLPGLPPPFSYIATWAE